MDMGIRKEYFWTGCIVLAVAGAGLWFGGFLPGEKRYGIVEGRIVDALSGGAVWQARIVVDGKSTFKYTSKTYRLSGIKPGSFMLRATAANYQPIERAITVKRGRNTVDIAMHGTGIPHLAGIMVFTQPLERGLQVEIRLVDQARLAIVNHPAIPCELEVALYQREGEHGRQLKGKKLFEGSLELFWDENDRLARNKAMIAWDRIMQRSAEKPYGIMTATLRTPQGSFSNSNDEVELFRQGP